MNYDFYVGEAAKWFEGELDEDDLEVYYLPCIVQVDDGTPSGTATCMASRHTIRIRTGTVIPVGSTANIKIAAIRNPDVDEALEYVVAVMRDGKVDDDLRTSVEYFFSIKSVAFSDLPTAYFDLFSVEAFNYGDVGLRGLRGNSQY